MNLRAGFLFLVLGYSKLIAQSSVSYSVNLAIDFENKQLFVKQKTHIDSSVITADTLYFNDWNHAYSSSKTPLANRFAEEFDRSFYLSSKNRLGATTILKIESNSNSLNWFRPKGHPDQIGVLIPPTVKKEGVDFYFEYQIQLPDARFSGYGYNESKHSLNLSDWLLSYTGPDTNLNNLVSNLNLDDPLLYPAAYKIQIELSEKAQIVSNLNRQNETLWTGKSANSPYFNINKSIDFFQHQLPNGSIVYSNIDYTNQSRDESYSQFERVNEFLDSQLGLNVTKAYVVSRDDYNKRPFYGLNQLPSFISPFPASLLNELKVLKTFTRTYVHSQVNLPRRDNQWFLEGLSIYLTIKYIEKYHKDLTYLGNLSKLFYLRTYGLAKMSFNDSFMTYTEFALRNNLQQAAASSKDVLTRFNERIAVPYHAGIGFRYLESYMGQNSFNQVLQQLLSTGSSAEIAAFFKRKENKNIQWFYDAYIQKRLGLDFKIQQKKKSKDTIEVVLTEKNSLPIPVKLSLLNKKTILSEKWVLPNENTAIEVNTDDATQIAINPFIGLPELNKENNWKSTQSKLFKKPISLKFVKDTEVPNRNQLFVNPLSNYNAYDGISLGFRLHNKKLTRQNFQIDFRPQYSFLESNLVGSYSISTRFNSLERKNFLTTLSISGYSFHYASGSRYNVVAPQLNFFFRTPDFRSNIRQGISASFYRITKDLSEGIETTPEYSVFKLRHLYSNRATINYLTLASNLELANSFSKLSVNVDYRKLFPSGRQFQARFFAGKFLRNVERNNDFFDFSLTRPNDYLFQYAYLGRSDTSGIYSQQLILAEGGLKSTFDSTNVGDYLVSTNLMLSLWKWFEVYGDIAFAKNYNQPLKTYWGSGLRINLVPDYLELYLPVYSNFGFELDNRAYVKNIRFVLSIEPKQLTTLFTRKWF